MKKLIKTAALGCILSSAALADGWEQSFDLGATVSKGNSDSVLASAGYTGKKVTEKKEIGLAGLYTYGEESGNKTNDELLASGFINHLYSDRFYAGLRGDLRIDTIAEIDYRATISGVAGYYLLKNDTSFFAIEAGPGFTLEEVAGETDEYLSIYIGQKFEHKFGEKTRLFETFSLTAPFDDVDDYSIVLEAGIETFLSDSLALKITLQNKYEAEPAADLDSNDFRLITGVSYKF